MCLGPKFWAAWLLSAESMAPEPKPMQHAATRKSANTGTVAYPASPSATSPVLNARSSPSRSARISRPASNPDVKYATAAVERMAPMPACDRPNVFRSDGHATPSAASGSPRLMNAR